MINKNRSINKIMLNDKKILIIITIFSVISLFIATKILSTDIKGIISNEFGINLYKDIDLDNNNDSAVIISNVANGNWDDRGKYIYLDNKQNIYIIGHSWNSSNNYDIFIMKFNKKGRLDENFANKGKLIIKDIFQEETNDYSSSICVNDKQEIYILGYSDKYSKYSIVDDTKVIKDIGKTLYIVKLKENGSIDKNFGKNGIFYLDENITKNRSFYANCMRVDKDGKIYIAGHFWNYDQNYDGYIMKINKNGELDINFGKKGILSLDNIKEKTRSDYINSFVIGKDNKIYITGCTSAGNKYNMFVIKIDNEGNLDKTFAKQGKLIQNILKNNGDIGRSIYISKNDNIYLIGSTWNGYNFDTYVIKMNNKGEIDNNFGENGKAIIDNPGKINDPYIDDFGNCIYVDRKEKIYISGETGKNNNYDIYIIRLNRKGKVDTSFGNQGKVIIKDVGNKNGDDRCESMTVNNNSIFLLGNNFNITNYDTFLIKIK